MCVCVCVCVHVSVYVLGSRCAYYKSEFHGAFHVRSGHLGEMFLSLGVMRSRKVEKFFLPLHQCALIMFANRALGFEVKQSHRRTRAKSTEDIGVHSNSFKNQNYHHLHTLSFQTNML